MAQGLVKRIAAIATGLACVAPSAVHAVDKRVYHIGNSVTDTINYTGLGQLAAAGQQKYTFGRHMIPGAPLAWIYGRGLDANGDGTPGDYSGFLDNKQVAWDAPDSQKAYAGALSGFEWEAVTLQPFDRQLGRTDQSLNTPDPTLSNDLPVIREYLKLLRQNAANADTVVYIYSRWSRRDTINNQVQPIDFAQKWNRLYTGAWDGTNESRDYFEKVLFGTREIMTGLGGDANNVRMVPVGDVMLELEARIRSGQVPGYTELTPLYVDAIHLTNVGSYMVGLTMYATIYGQNPVGLPISPAYTATGYGGTAPLPISESLAAVLQDVVWDVVSTHPYAGVTVPEPSSFLIFTAAGAAFLLRRPRWITC